MFTSDSLSKEHDVKVVVKYSKFIKIIPKHFVEFCLPAAGLQFANCGLE